MTIFFVDTRPDWSSTPVRPTPTLELIGEVICAVVNCLLFNALVFLAFFLYLQVHVYRQSRRRFIHSPSSRPNGAMMMNASQPPFVVLFVAEWMQRGMDFGLLFCLGFLVLVTYEMYLDCCRLYRGLCRLVRFLSRLFRDLYDYVFKVKPPTIYHAENVGSMVSNQGGGGGRPTMTPCRVPPTAKTRFLIVVRRTNPLYWHHPMLCFEEYRAARRRRRPGRAFVSEGRTLPTIREERQVHFLQGDVAEVHLVPSGDDLDEVPLVDLVLDKPVDSTSASESESYIPSTMSEDEDDEDEYPTGDDDEVPSEENISVEPPRETRIATVPRRSKRLAEIRLREQLASSCCRSHDVPELLGSIFVNGLRRSSRHLVKKNVGRHQQ